jgi:hypothetical protein
MSKKSIVVLIATLTAISCGGSSPAPQGPGVAGVSVQASDVPHAMVKCDLTGDINSFIKKEQGPDPQTSKSTASQWGDAQKNGASAAYVAIYTDSAANCSAIKSSASDISTANYKLVVNFVVQFKDEKSAASAYTSGSIFNISQSNFRGPASQPIEGTKTGLTANSIVLSQTFANQTFYIAMWQNKTFEVILIALNLDPTASKKVATGENSRIK